jgi:hypothetical protein
MQSRSGKHFKSGNPPYVLNSYDKFLHGEQIMEALRQVHQIKGNELHIGLPASWIDSLQEKWVEIIISPLPMMRQKKDHEEQQTQKRQPHPALADSVIIGDIMSPTTNDSDWDALK